MQATRVVGKVDGVNNVGDAFRTANQGPALRVSVNAPYTFNVKFHEVKFVPDPQVAL
jgi:hypothetical protein